MKVLLSSVISLFLLFSMPVIVLAAPYGSGTYGNGTYGSGTSGNGNSNNNTSSTNSISSVLNSIGSSVSTFFCTAQAPASAPTLYEIDATTTTAKLFLSPAGGPYDAHYIAFGPGNKNEGHGAQFNSSQVNGALVFTVNQLSPNTTYTFKVRGQNSCKPGSWSNDLAIKTQPKGKKTIAKFYLKKTNPPVAKKQSVFGFVKQMPPQSPTATTIPQVKVQSKVKGIKTQSQEAPAVKTSVWDSIVNFFSGRH